MKSPAPERDTRFVHEDGEKLARLRAAFAAIADLPSERRADWIATHIADADERNTLLDLLAADAVDRGLLDTPAGEIAASLNAEVVPLDGLIGQRIGVFRLTRMLGKGGMATVFLGEREQADFRQKVAVKILRRGLYSEIEQRLFLRERQVLASLDHPNIARLFDGGVTDAGIPFLVMEYVDGKPITRYVADEGLGLRERMALVLIVCRAVEAAHRALVVHRDIKPANILVSADGSVKLLDFGIAKLLEDDIENPTIGVFTPDYAAPEQLRRGPITTATDVYGLGVLMHELLLGVRPSATEAPRKPSVVAAEIVPADSQALGLFTQDMRSALPGDLDNIILKALAAEPERRYASAGALADDIRRYLDGRPVAAHPPSTWYRARKFVSRHKGAVATTAAFVLIVLSALATAIWQAGIARHEAHRANTVRDFVESVFDPLSDGVIEGKQPSYADLLGKSVLKLDQDAQLGPAERVDLLLLFARLEEKIGEHDKAQALADRASAISDAELGANHPLSDQARAESGIVAEHYGSTDKAQKALADSEARYRRDGIRGAPLIRLYTGLSALADDHGDVSAEVRYAQLGLDETLASFPNDVRRTASAYHNLGFALEAVGDFDGATNAYRSSYESDLRDFAADSFETGVSLATLGIAEGLSGQLRRARSDVVGAEAIFAKSNNKPREIQATNAGYLCVVDATMALDSAPQSCADAVRVNEAVYGKNNSSYALAQRLAGMQHLERGEWDAARALFEASLAGLASNDNRPWRGRVEINLGELAWLEHRPQDALQTLRRGVDDLGAGYPPTLRRDGLAWLALVCRETDAPCAADAYQRAVREISSTSYAWTTMLLPAQTALARVEIRDGKPRPAMERLTRAIERAKPEVDARSLRLEDAELWLALAEANAGDCGAARAQVDSLLSASTSEIRTNPLLDDVRAALKSAQGCDLAMP